MTWDEICHVFSTACISWDPAIFTHSLTFHECVPDLGLILSGELTSSCIKFVEPKKFLCKGWHRFVDFPSYSPCSHWVSRLGLHRHLRLKVTTINHKADHPEQNVWFLLTRHVTETKRTSDYIALKVESEFNHKIEQRIDKIAEKVSYLSLILFTFAYLY